MPRRKGEPRFAFVAYDVETTWRRDVDDDAGDAEEARREDEGLAFFPR